MNRIPYGLKLNENHKLVPDIPASEIVTSIFAIYLEGKSLGAISAELKEKGISSPTGKVNWSRQMIDNILNNILYVNLIIAPNIFQKVQDEKIKRSNTAYSKNGNKARKSTRYNSKNVLSGLLVCSECGNNYRRITKSSGEIVWRCANRVEHGNKICKNSPTITDSEIKEIICDTMNMAEFDEEMISEKIDYIEISDAIKIKFSQHMHNFEMSM